MAFHLTKKEALTVLCSVVKHAVRGWRTNEVREETLYVVESFSLLHECFSHFLSTLQQNRAKSRLLLYLFYEKESLKFPTH